MVHVDSVDRGKIETARSGETSAHEPIAVGQDYAGIAWDRLAVRRFVQEVWLTGDAGALMGAISISIHIDRSGQKIRSPARLNGDGSFRSFPIAASTGEMLEVSISFGSRDAPATPGPQARKISFSVPVPLISRPLAS
jgi:hypothetical protein